MQMSSFFVLIPGFGAPHANVKRDVLISNVERIILSNTWSRVNVVVCIYDDTPLDEKLFERYPEVTLTIKREPGMPGGFIKKHAAPSNVDGYDYILILFDDIVLQPNVDFPSIIRLKDDFCLNIVSPTLTLDSPTVFDFMRTVPPNPAILKIVPCCECFCYFMDRASFVDKYYPHVDPDINPWLWGLDLMLRYKLGLRVGMLNHMTMQHLYKNTCYVKRPEADPFEGRSATFKKHGIVDLKEVTEQRSVLYWII